MDAYTVAFGIRNVTDRDAALSEAYRVLKRGGRLLCLEFSQVSLPLLRQAYDLYSFNVIPKIGGLVAGDEGSYQYLVESIRQFPDQVSAAQLGLLVLVLLLNWVEATPDRSFKSQGHRLQSVRGLRELQTGAMCAAAVCGAAGTVAFMWCSKTCEVGVPAWGKSCGSSGWDSAYAVSLHVPAMLHHYDCIVPSHLPNKAMC
jgi:hypothetical protein